MSTEGGGPEFVIRIEENHVPCPVLTVHGDLDIFTANQLRHRLLELINDGHGQLILNLDGLGFIDSAGLAVVIGCFKRLQLVEGGQLAVICGQPRILKVFDISGLRPIIPIASSLDEALTRIGLSSGPAESAGDPR